MRLPFELNRVRGSLDFSARSPIIARPARGPAGPCDHRGMGAQSIFEATNTERPSFESKTPPLFPALKLEIMLAGLSIQRLAPHLWMTLRRPSCRHVIRPL